MMDQQQWQRGGVLVRLLIVVFFLGVLALLGLFGAAYELDRRATANGPLTEEKVLWIERGNTVDAVIVKLEDMGAIETPLVFKLKSRLENLAPALKAGEYEIPAHASQADIIALLKEGKPLLRFVTIAEGLTTAQIIQRVDETPMLVGDVTLSPAEGDLLPETYSYQRGDTRDSVIQRMADAHDRVLDELWPARAEDLPIKTPEEAVILASIVEKETGIAEERPRVASVFVNRLRRGMRLQSDPTIIYGLTQGEPLGRGLRVSELRKETPYNTYIIRGLPPTPIANPGEAALRAVLTPLETDDLYFVADGTGGHVFAKSLAEHNRNVARWRQIERSRNAAN